MICRAEKKNHSGERKEKKRGFMGRKPLSFPDAESEMKQTMHALWESQRSCRGNQESTGRSSGELSWDNTPYYFEQSCISNSIPKWGNGELMHKSHNFMRIDVSLPPGIMRDRALAERDFVTFPEIFFFSVLSNRCRAM